MRHVTFALNFGTALLTVASGVVFVAPVARTLIAGGRFDAISAMTVAPALITLILMPVALVGIRSALIRLTAIVVVSAAAIAARFGLQMEALGSPLAVPLLTALMVLGAVVWAGWTRQNAAKHRREVALLAQRLCAIIAEVTDQLRRRYAGSPDAHRPSGPLSHVFSVERAVLSIVTEALIEGEPEAFAALIARDLADLRANVEAHHRRDGERYAQEATAEFCVRLHGELRSRVPSATPVMRTARLSGQV